MQFRFVWCWVNDSAILFCFVLFDQQTAIHHDRQRHVQFKFVWCWVNDSAI